MDAPDSKRLKAPEDEGESIKKLLADQMSDNAVLRESNSKVVMPVAKHKAVAHACDKQGVGQRGALSCPRS